MRTSRPQVSEPRMSMRAGSASVVPASHQRVGMPPLHDALDRRELCAVVDAAHVAARRRRRRATGMPSAHGQRDDVGQVELALRVVGLSAATQRRSSAVGAASTPV